jgi:serine/arginine repetitive matrix protein 1
MSFPKCFDQKVNMKKVKKEVIDQWITEKITGLLGFEDEIVVSMAINLLETKVDEPLNPRHIQISLMGFLEKDCPAFVKELWELLLSAQEHPTGIPPQLLEKKKQEMLAVAKQKDKLRKVLENKRNDSRRSRFDDYSTKRREERIEERKIESKEQERKRRGRSRSRSNENHRQRRLRSRSRSYRRTRRKSPSSSRSPSQSRSRQRHGYVIFVLLFSYGISLKINRPRNVSEDQFGRAKRGSVRKSR